MSVNNIQIGGEHYKTSKKDGVQHWDYSVAVNLPCLEYACSKYLTRCGKKDNSIQEVKKSLHYMEKRLECYHRHVGIVKGANRNQGLFNRFIEDNGIPQDRREIIDLVMHWRGVDQLERSVEMIRDLIKKMENV